MNKKLRHVAKEIAKLNIAKELIEFENDSAIYWSRESQDLYNNTRRLFAEINIYEWNRETSEHYLNEFINYIFRSNLFCVKVTFNVEKWKGKEIKDIYIPMDLILELFDNEEKVSFFNSDIKNINNINNDITFRSVINDILKILKDIFRKDKINYFEILNISNIIYYQKFNLENLELSRQLLEIRNPSPTKDYLLYMLSEYLIKYEYNTETQEKYDRNIYLFNRISNRDWNLELLEEYMLENSKEKDKVKIKYNYVLEEAGTDKSAIGNAEIIIPTSIFKSMIGNHEMELPYNNSSEIEVLIRGTSILEEIRKIHTFIHFKQLFDSYTYISNVKIASINAES